MSTRPLKGKRDQEILQIACLTKIGSTNLEKSVDSEYIFASVVLMCFRQLIEVIQNPFIHTSQLCRRYVSSVLATRGCFYGLQFRLYPAKAMIII